MFTNNNANYKTILQNTVNKQTRNIHENVNEIK